jgi:hypothetical protein
MAWKWEWCTLELLLVTVFIEAVSEKQEISFLKNWVDIGYIAP